MFIEILERLGRELLENGGCKVEVFRTYIELLEYFEYSDSAKVLIVNSVHKNGLMSCNKGTVKQILDIYSRMK